MKGKYKSVLFGLITGLMGMYSCGDNPKRQKVRDEVQLSDKHKDSLQQPVFGDEELEKNPFDMYECYPLSSMYIFEYQVNNTFFDKLWKNYKLDPESQVQKKIDICGGDYCHSYEALKNSKDHIEIYLFKNESGEYGFGNEEFVLRNDSLIFYRDFNVSIYDFPTDTTQTTWDVSESVYVVHGGKVKQTTKSTKTSDFKTFDYTLKTLSKKEDNLQYSSWSKKMKAELKKSINWKGIE